MKPLADLTDLQLAILRVVWARGEATANAIHEALAPSTRLARGTIGAMLHRLERQGVLRHRLDGREYHYRAAVTPERVKAARLGGLLENLFDGDLTAMVSFAVSKSETQQGDVEKLRRMLGEHRDRSRQR